MRIALAAVVLSAPLFVGFQARNVDLEKEIAALKFRVAALEKAQVADPESRLKGLETRIAQSLESRIADLEERFRRRVAWVEERVTEMVKQQTQGARQAQQVPGWKTYANWSKLQLGMTMSQVTALLGEPEDKDQSVVKALNWMRVTWYYGGRSGYVTFEFDKVSPDLKLCAWSSP